MSTRCNIIVQDADSKYTLYHHCDGYPEYVGVCLYKALYERIQKHKYEAFEIVNMLVKAQLEGIDTSYELTFGLHGDIEYLYVVDLNFKTIRCYSVENWEGLDVHEEIDLTTVKPLENGND